MNSDWIPTTWGELATLEYGKALRDYKEAGTYRVFGTNGPIGWHNHYLFEGPSVIIGRKGAYRGVLYTSDPFFVIDTAFYLKPKRPFNMRWAYYQLLTQDINSMDSGSAIPSTSREDFYQLPLLFPPQRDQEAIAAILGGLDDKIDINMKLTATLEEIMNAIFCSWFRDFDPVRAKAAAMREGSDPQHAAMVAIRDENDLNKLSADTLASLVDTVSLFPDSMVKDGFGEYPKGWAVKPLGECADIVGGSTPSTSEAKYWNGDIAWGNPTGFIPSNFVCFARN